MFALNIVCQRRTALPFGVCKVSLTRLLKYEWNLKREKKNEEKKEPLYLLNIYFNIVSN